MVLRDYDRNGTRQQLRAARQRVMELQPFSPAWDAAMARVEDLERLIWRQDLARTGDPRIAAMQAN